MSSPRSRRKPRPSRAVASPTRRGAPRAAQVGLAPPRFSLRQVPRPALWLGLAGLIPFAALAIAVHLAPAPWAAEARGSLAIYGAVILSFMGGCRWGFAAAGLGEGATWWRLSVSVIPALLAWAALSVGETAALWAGAMGMAALFAADVALTGAWGAPVWWPALRLPLSAGAAAALLAGALA